MAVADGQLHAKPNFGNLPREQGRQGQSQFLAPRQVMLSVMRHLCVGAWFRRDVFCSPVPPLLICLTWNKLGQVVVHRFPCGDQFAKLYGCSLSRGFNATMVQDKSPDFAWNRIPLLTMPPITIPDVFHLGKNTTKMKL